MSKKLLIFLTFITSALSGMQPAAKQNSICYLLQLPPEIQCMIASYLTFRDRESDEEFIKRAYQIKNNIPKSIETFNALLRVEERSTFPFLQKNFVLTVYNKKNKNMQELYHYHNQSEAFQTVFAFSPDGLQVVWTAKNIITLHNLITGARRKFPFDLTDDDGKKGRLNALCISSDAKMIAITKNNNEKHRFEMYPTSNAGPIELTTDDEEKIMVETNGIDLACNKQGTKIMLYGNNSHELFLFRPPEEDREKSIKSLEIYFRQKGVCKHLTQQ